MQKSHFEILLEEAQAKVKDGLVRLSLDDVHLVARHAKLAGHFAGLEEAAKLYRESARRDVEEDKF